MNDVIIGLEGKYGKDADSPCFLFLAAYVVVRFDCVLKYFNSSTVNISSQ